MFVTIFLGRLDLRSGHLHYCIEDDGRPFDPRGVPVPDTAAPLEERPIGGLGLLLVRRLTDELHYERSFHPAFWVALFRLWFSWRSVLVVVQPYTVVRWHGCRFRGFNSRRHASRRRVTTI